MHALEWAQLPGDLIFIAAGVIPLVIAAFKTSVDLQRGPHRAMAPGQGNS